MPLFKKQRSPFWWYSITIEGKRYRASTGLLHSQRTKTAAATMEAAALLARSKGDALPKVAHGATLHAFSVRFLEWVFRSTQLSDATRRYYRYGWRLLDYSALANLRVDAISRDDVECTVFRRPVIDRRTGKATGDFVKLSPAYTNQALRTLKVMLGKAEEWSLIDRRPKFSTVTARGREKLVDSTIEANLQFALMTPDKNGRIRRLREQAWVVMVILQDTGMRPQDVFPLRVEHLDRVNRRIWVPSGKTANARRFVGMSERMLQLLDVWCAGRTEGWVFPSSRSKCGHLTSIHKGFRTACERQNIVGIVPYSARHTYGTFGMAATKNIFAVSKAMGHADIKSMEPYQHPELTELNQAIDRRNRERDSALTAPHFGHTVGHTDPRSSKQRP
jgi:integrase